MAPAPHRSRSAFFAALDAEAVAQVERDAAVFEACVDAARARAAGEAEGFFGPTSMLWRQEMQTGGELEPATAARELMRSVVDSTPGRTLLRRSGTPLSWLDDAWLAGTVPPDWAVPLEIQSTPAQQRSFEKFCLASRTALPIVPLQLRRSPAYHQALLRIARARGARPTRTAVLVDRLNARVTLPFSLRPVAKLQEEARDVHAELFG